MIGVSEFQYTINPLADSGQAQRASGHFQTRETLHEPPQAAAVEPRQVGDVEDHALLMFLEEFIEGQLQLLALDTHLERASQLQNDNSRFEFSLDNVQGCHPDSEKILTGMAKSSQPQLAG
jgi:hypothetical protein